jgi:hypothetical protein
MYCPRTGAAGGEGAAGAAPVPPPAPPPRRQHAPPARGPQAPRRPRPAAGRQQAGGCQKQHVAYTAPLSRGDGGARGWGRPGSMGGWRRARPWRVPPHRGRPAAAAEPALAATTPSRPPTVSCPRKKKSAYTPRAGAAKGWGGPGAQRRGAPQGHEDVRWERACRAALRGAARGARAVRRRRGHEVGSAVGAEGGATGAQGPS